MPDKDVKNEKPAGLLAGEQEEKDKNVVPVEKALENPDTKKSVDREIEKLRNLKFKDHEAGQDLSKQNPNKLSNNPDKNNEDKSQNSR